MKKFAATLLFVIASVVVAQAQDWPNRAVRIIVPFGAGGSSDTLARIVADHLASALKQQIVVENRTGAGGMIGVQAIAAAPPDGYTLGITNISTLSLIPVINPAANYHPLNDFTHIAYIAGAPVVLAASAKTGVKTLKEFIAYANAPGQAFTFASSGVGSDGHLMGQAIALSTKVKVEHVPYRGTMQALSDIVAGHVPFSTFTLSSTSSFLRARTLNGIAVTSPERMPDYPDVPTFKELGHLDLVGTTWFSLSGPAKLPAEIVNTVNREVAAALRKPEVQERLGRDGFIAQPMTPDEFTNFVASENAKWKPLIESAGLAGKGSN